MKKSSIPVYRRIIFKLTVSFLLPACFIVVLGVASYNTAERVIKSNYERSNLQTMGAMNRYLSLILDGYRNMATQYVIDDDLTSYLRGVYAGRDDIRQLELWRTYSDRAKDEIMGDKRLARISILTPTVTPVMTGNSKTIDKQSLYDTYLGTPQGAALLEGEYPFYLFAADASNDEALQYGAAVKYSLRIAKKHPKLDTVFLYDIDRSALEETFAALVADTEMGTGAGAGGAGASGAGTGGAGASSAGAGGAGANADGAAADAGPMLTVGLITADGTAIYADGAAPSMDIANADYYREILASDELEGLRYVEDGEYLFSYSKLERWGAVLVCLIPNSVILSEAGSIKTLTVTITLVAAIISGLIGFLTALHYSKAIGEMLTPLRSATKGDLTVTASTHRHDEFRLLADGINTMIGHIKSILERVTEVSETLGESAAGIASTSRTFLAATQGITRSVGEIEQGTQRMDTDSADCLAKMDSLSGRIKDVSRYTDSIMATAGGAGDAVSTGLSSVERLNDAARSTYEITQTVIRSIEALEVQSRSIDEIIASINNIAEETSLLSLNASIEAARAGEAGRGFTVVADQIKRLASQSIESSDQIRRIIEEVVRSTHEAVDIAKQSEVIVASQEEAVRTTGKAFRDIDSRVRGLVESLATINDNVDLMDEDRHNTLHAVQSIASVSAQTASGASDVTGQTEAELQAVTQLDTEATALRGISEQLAELLAQFRT